MPPEFGFARVGLFSGFLRDHPRNPWSIFLRMNRRRFLFAALAPLLLGGCLNVKTAPIEVKPIHITVDVNVKVEKALDDFFGDLDKKSATTTHEENK